MAATTSGPVEWAGDASMSAPRPSRTASTAPPTAPWSPEAAQPLGRSLAVVQLLARQGRAAQNEIVLGVAQAQLPGRDVAEDRADRGYHCLPSPSRSRSGVDRCSTS
ncbi:hypothetical protein [Streptomyces sp. NPDC059757]|uniref:hypothetical protein n=1 Tax=Streptomyces sp. NPDC059757 TaxID=3346935 RepID=UPI0036688CE4